MHVSGQYCPFAVMLNKSGDGQIKMC